MKAPALAERSSFAQTGSERPNRVHDFGYSFGQLPVYSRGERANRFDSQFASQLDPHTRRPAQAVLSAATQGVTGSGRSLPHREEIQRSFGKHRLGPVSAHMDAPALAASRAIGARAYTTGNRIAFAGSPDLRTAAHEAAHVIQQRAGAKPVGNIGRTGDALEQHADAVADRVVGSQSTESLLGAPPASKTATSEQPILQRDAIPTDFGKFDTAQYDTIGTGNDAYGLNMELHFDPNPDKVNAKKIGLIQSVHSNLNGKDVANTPAVANRMAPKGDGAGSAIDTQGTGKFGNPLYPAMEPKAKDKLGDTKTDPTYGQNGFHYKEGKAVHHQIAILKDGAQMHGRGNNSSQKFEVAALAVEGVQSGTYMGSINWGWSVDNAGKFTQDPITLKSAGKPSTGFQAAAKQWNQTSVGGVTRTINDLTILYDDSFKMIETVKKGTEIKIGDVAKIHDSEIYDAVTVADGDKRGDTGYMKVNKLQETGGAPVIQLPTP